MTPGKEFLCDFGYLKTVEKESRGSPKSGSELADYPEADRIRGKMRHWNENEIEDNYITEDNPLTERFLNEYMTAENQMYCFPGTEDDESVEGDLI